MSLEAIVTKTLSMIIDEGRNYFDRRRTEFFEEFYEELYKGVADQDRLEYERKIKATEDDFYGILSAAVNDSEKAKIRIYINLYKAIRDTKVPQNKKLQYLTLAKTLPYSALKLLPEMYVYVKNPTHESMESYTKKLESNNDLEYEIHLLIQNGLLLRREGINGENLDTTKLCINLTEVFFLPEELTPKAQNIKVWAKKIGILYNSSEINQLTYIQNLLEKASIKNSFTNNVNHAIEPADLRHYQKFIIIVDKNKLRNEVIERLEKYSDFLDIIKVTFEKDTIDQLPNIGGKLIYLEKENKESEKNFLGNFEVDVQDLF